MTFADIIRPLRVGEVYFSIKTKTMLKIESKNTFSIAVLDYNTGNIRQINTKEILGLLSLNYFDNLSNKDFISFCVLFLKCGITDTALSFFENAAELKGIDFSKITGIKTVKEKYKLIIKLEE